MKKHLLEFARRGVVACGFGPVVLAALYLILQKNGVVETLSVDQVSTGIFSLTALAFIAGGMNCVYRIEELPLMVAVLIHGGVLYMAYLATYLINGWLQWGTAPILVFTGIFVVGYLLIWAVIYSVIRRKTRNLNEILRQKRMQN